MDNNSRLGQLDAIKLVFTVQVLNQTLEVTQLRTEHGGVAYGLSQQCLLGTCKYTDVFNEMAGSFEWKNPWV
jgi:hypothetical protein